MMAKKHILWITPGFPASETDSQCIPALQVFAENINKHTELEISIISLHFPQRDGQWQWHGLDVYSAYGRNKMAIYFNAWKKIQSINRAKPIDIIHSFWLNDAAVLGYYIGLLKGIPHFTTLMGQDVRPSNAYLKWLPLGAFKVIALSDFHARTYLETTGIFVDKIIPWGVDKLPIDSSTSERKIDILGVGNLVKLKAFDQFIRIIGKIKTLQKLKVQIIGDGPERERLEQLITDLGLNKVIRFCGNMEREEVLKRMKQSKILLHPSTFESFGLVFLEALEGGAYIVSREVGIAQPFERWLLAESEEEFIEKCMVILNEKTDYTSLRPYPIEKTVKAYLDYYSNFQNVS